MFKTNEKGDQHESVESAKVSLLSTVDFSKVQTEEDFGNWLEESLEILVTQFEEFETDDSVRKFFSR